ncbi:F-box protein-like [Forsythia ovata]|uniref:F-box protein-like n=1 Tax=Forsythia ovata TaxID=205694 RepID=A0ABD1R591_9LAMI
MNGKLCSAYASGRSIIVQVLANAHSNTMQMSSHSWMREEKQRVILDKEVVGGGGGVASDPVVVVATGNKLLVQMARKLYVYNLLTKETKALGMPPSTGGDTRYIPYVNSLVCL